MNLAAQQTSEFHTAVFNSLDEQIAIVDNKGNILDVNKAWRDFGTGNGLTSAYSCTGQNYLRTLTNSVASGDVLASQAMKGLEEVLCGKRTKFYFEYPCHSPDEKRWFIMRVAPLYGDETGSLFVISHHNITQRKLAEERIEELAMQDSLTELANRRGFDAFLDREIRRSMRQQKALALVLVDVDSFKEYNDELGHAAGDDCLVSIGEVLQDHARRSGDLAARVGGDEFALILGTTELDAATAIAQSILEGIEALDMRFADTKQVTVSAGLVCMIPDEDRTEDFLYEAADEALYRAKSSGRNQLARYQQ